jgi:spore maturation protein CgeB
MSPKFPQNNGFLLTSHSERNPLIVGLRESGLNVLCIKDIKTARKNLNGCMAYYGNLFSEIKNPITFFFLLIALHRRRIPYIFWNRDAPWNVGMKKHHAWLLNLLKPVDIYLTHSLQRSRWFSANTAIYFPNAAQQIYCVNNDLTDLRNPSSYCHDVTFIGAISNQKRRNCRERRCFIDAVQENLKAHTSTVKIHIVDTTYNALNAEEYRSLIRSSKINLNFGAMCDLPNEPSWGMPERVFGIAAAGGFLLTDWRASIPDTFPEGSCVFFYTPEDCARKILHHLQHFNDTRDRAEYLHRLVLTEHTYHIRAQQLISIIRKYPHR